MPKLADWTTENAITLITGWKRDGLSNIQIAENIGISETTLYRWKAKDERIERALETGKELSNFHIENALFKSATGYYYEETQTESKFVDGVEMKTGSRTIRKYAQPNIKAIELWLKTKWPERYAEKEAVQIDLLRQELNTALEMNDDQLSKLDAVLAQIKGNVGKI